MVDKRSIFGWDGNSWSVELSCGVPDCPATVELALHMRARRVDLDPEYLRMGRRTANALHALGWSWDDWTGMPSAEDETFCPACHADGPTGLYLVASSGRSAVKVGVAQVFGRRLFDHRREGWRLASTSEEHEFYWELPTREQAMLVEGQVIKRWRSGGIPEADSCHDMPQHGRTETAPISAVNLDDLHAFMSWCVQEIHSQEP
ncbi:hypothetical protein AB0M43_36720 [Longispora sp. NPDC051575]|uniref:hypothetical protein n=1 Tax=Longispora sp. NPDC051575 TaxID=3154943 RepID=UPI00344913DF